MTSAGAFASIKLPPSAAQLAAGTDLSPVATLGTRRGLKPKPSKPSLQDLFEPSSAANVNDAVPKAKTVRIASGAPSIIDRFAPAEGGRVVYPALPDSDDEFDEGEREDGSSESSSRMGEDEMMRHMEEQGLEVVMVYEEEPETEVVAEEHMRGV